MNPYELRFYSWGGIRCSYGCGEAWVIAGNVTEARELLLKQWREVYSIDTVTGEFILTDESSDDARRIVQDEPEVTEIERGLIIEWWGSD